MNNNAVKLLRALVEISVKNPAPRKAEYAGSWKSFLIAVDKDNTAEILMPEEVYNKLLEVKVSPTPREQELEAQNKALWELVGLTETTLNYCKEEIEGWGLELYNTGQPWQGHRCDATKVAKHQITKVDETLAAIQKAKEK